MEDDDTKKKVFEGEYQDFDEPYEPSNEIYGNQTSVNNFQKLNYFKSEQNLDENDDYRPQTEINKNNKKKKGDFSRKNSELNQSPLKFMGKKKKKEPLKKKESKLEFLSKNKTKEKEEKPKEDVYVKYNNEEVAVNNEIGDDYFQINNNQERGDLYDRMNNDDPNVNQISSAYMSTTNHNLPENFDMVISTNNNNN